MWIVIGIVVVIAIIGFTTAVTAPARRRSHAIRSALEAANDELARNPNDLGAKVRLAKVELELANRPPEALPILEQVDRAAPHHWIPGEKPTKVLLADAFVGLGRLDDAIATLQRFVDELKEYDTGGDSERKWQLETYKVEAEQRIRMLKKGDTHVHQPEKWGDSA